MAERINIKIDYEATSPDDPEFGVENHTIFRGVSYADFIAFEEAVWLPQQAAMVEFGKAKLKEKQDKDKPA